MSSAAAGVNAGARLDHMKIGRFQTRILLFISLGMFLDAFDIYLAGGVLGALLDEGWSTLDLNAAFISATFFGMMIGAVSAGILGDHFGRRFSYQLNLIIFGGASFAAAAAPSMEWLIFFRFVMGIGLGAEVAIGFAAISEFVPAKSRGRWIGAASLIANSALFAASAIGLAVIPNFGGRPMFLIVGVGAALLWYARKSMPESPRWLEQQGRHDEAEQLLQRIEAECGVEPNAPPVADTATVSLVSSAKPATSILVLFRRGVVLRTLLAASFHIAVGFSLYGLITGMPTFFVEQGITIASSLAFTTVMTVGGPLGALLGFLVADRINRRPTMIVVPLVSAALAMIYPFMLNPVFLLVIGFALVTSIYFWLTIGQLVQTELFATEYRLRGTGFCGMVGRMITAFVQFPIVFAFQWGGVVAVVGVVALILTMLAGLFLFIGIETRQKSLETLAPVL